MIKQAWQKKNSPSKQHKGFTLVELIVIIGILLTLSILAVIAYSGWQEEAHKAAVSADAGSVARALNLYNSLSKAPINEADPVPAGGVISLKLTAADIAGIDERDMSIVINSNRVTDVNAVLDYDDTTKLYTVDMSKLP